MGAQHNAQVNISRSCLFLLGLRWLLALALLSATSICAQPLVIDGQRAELRLEPYTRYWVEDGTALGVADIAAQEAKKPFTPLRTGQKFSIHNKALWLRFDIAITSQHQRWYLELERPGLDLAELFYVSPSGQWVRQAAGDALPLREWAQAARYPIFELSPQGASTVRYYLRVQHQRVAYSAPVLVINSSELTAEHERDQLLLGAYFGVSLLLIAIASAMAVTYRSKLFAYFAFAGVAMTLTQTTLTGVGGQYLWPNNPYWANALGYLFPLLLSASALWFVQAISRPTRFVQWRDRFVVMWVVLLVAGGLVDAWYPSVAGALINSGLMAVSTVATAALLIIAAYEGDRHARWLCAGLLPVLVLGALALLRNFGLVPSTALISYGMLAGVTVLAPVVFYALYRRLAHERESEVRSRALSQIDPLTGLMQRRAFESRLQATLLRAKRYGQQCALLLLDLTNHSAILKAHGREAADRAMVVTASRLRKAVRDIDTAARLGDHQFALLIEAPSTSRDALAVATHAVAMALRSSEELPEGAALTLRVVVALLPDAERTPERPLAWMEAALAAMDDQSTKTIRTLNF